MRRRLRSGLAALAVAVAFGWVGAAQAGARVALVIGNSHYESLPPLKNAENDSRAVADVLRQAGFDVYSGADLTRLKFDEVMRQFFRAANGADAAIVYYSGHGVQVGGRNFLVPTDATLSTPYDIEQQTIDAADMHRYLAAHARAQLIFLDACRDNPFKIDKFWIADSLTPVAQTRGLARIGDSAGGSSLPANPVTGAIGSLLAYSTEPGAVALDGTGMLSPYTTAFVKYAATANLEVRQMLTMVRRDVIQQTQGRQIPWENSSLTEDVYLFRSPPPPIVQQMARVEAVAGKPGPMLLPEPRQPGGRDLRARIETAPDKGVVLLNGRRLTTGDIVSASDLRALVYDPGEAPAGSVSLMSYAVLDSWGQSSPGVAAITVAASPAAQVAQASQAEDAARRRVAEASAYLKSLDGKASTATIGVGPQPLGLSPPPADKEVAGLDVVVAATPDFGSLLIGDRPVAKGQRIALADASRLAFQPPVGSEKRSGRLALELPGGQAAAAVDLKPTMEACDAEAGAPLDLQGVARGRLPNEIDAKALEDCRSAAARQPDVARFRYQLGRALIAARKPAEARDQIAEAARRRHLRAIWEQGNFEAFGAFGKPDLAKAAALYQSCSTGGDPYCLFSYGKALFYGQGEAKNVSRGLELMLGAAELGHTYAMNEIGYVFTYGRNVEKDVERGLRFYEAGAARADIYSYNNLGLVYLRGAGRPADPAKAMDYFRKAADGGHPYAPTNIGRMYRDGVGVQADAQEAARWLALGAERGDYWGALDRGRIGLSGDRVEATRYLALAVWLNKLRDNTDPDRQAEQALKQAPAADKRKAAEALAAALGPEARQARSGDLDTRLADLAERAWKKRNPRYDLF
ncbi:MAG: caspase family protein [Rhizobiales bacterium]|nr:caspase family protein [Hyphomicrobiales bacterium]